MINDSNVPSIQRLPENVVNRIAAGEVIVRPANAVKELMENSLDAGSTMISITLKEGGMKSLQIQDDGHGIRPEDFPILCERFTTSKLSSVDDLKTLQTFGFRGEALASISHVSHLSITSRTRNSSIAYTAKFKEGIMEGTAPKICAAPVGTFVAFTDLFYNLPVRKQVLGSQLDETSRVLDVVQKYSIHYHSVSFSCRRTDRNVVDLRTEGGRESSVLAVISDLYGSSLANSLLPFSIHPPTPSECEGRKKHTSHYPTLCSLTHEHQVVDMSSPQSLLSKHIKVFGLVNASNPTIKKSTFILFVNGRLVSSSLLKKGVECVMQDHLPKGAKYFVYLSLYVPSTDIDVNVHPTKSEVIFLHEELLFSAVVEAIEGRIKKNEDSRSFEAVALPTVQEQLQKKIVSFVTTTPETMIEDVVSLEVSTQSVGSTKSVTRVRTDNNQMSMRSFIEVETKNEKTGPVITRVENSTLSNYLLGCQRNAKENSDADSLESVEYITHTLETSGSTALYPLLQKSVWVGAVNLDQCVVQSGSQLVLVALRQVFFNAVYQSILYRLGKVPFCHLTEGVNLKLLVKSFYYSVGNEEEVDDLIYDYFPASFKELRRKKIAEVKATLRDNDGGQTREDLIENIVNVIVEFKSPLEDYLSILFANNEIIAIPEVVAGVNPRLEELPQLIFDAYVSLQLEEEVHIIESLAMSVGRCYSTLTDKSLEKEKHISRSKKQNMGEDVPETLLAVEDQYNRWVLEHIVYRAIKEFPTILALEGKQYWKVLTSLEKLYRVFERC